METKSKKVELHACESRACPSYGIMIEHEMLIIDEYEAIYEVLVCPKCETRTYCVLKYHSRFIDENPLEGGARAWERPIKWCIKKPVIE